MSDAPLMDLNELIDGQRVRRFSIVFLIVATLALVSDGFDIAAMGFVGPELAKQWHIAPAALVTVFSAGIVGLFVGAPVLGYVGDRFGRKKAILAGLAVVGSVTLATMEAGSLQQLMVLRFLAGIGLGGIIPNIIALTAEIAPRRLRGRFIVLVGFGVPAGIALPGLVAAALVPRFGWPVLFLVGGLLPLIMVPFVALLIPESLKYLAQRGDRDDAVRRIARLLRPDLAIAASSRFTAPGEVRVAASGSPAQLFAGGRGLATPMLWIALAANQMANFFTITWLPTLLQSAGSSTAQAGISASMFAIGGLAGGVVLSFLVDRFGAVPMVVLFIVGVPLVAAIGVGGLPPALAGVIIAGAGFCVTGNNFGINATLGAIYPTRMRSIGTGWAQAVGRVGSLGAPIIGGMLLHSGFSMQELLFAPAMTLAVGAIAWAIFTALCVRRFRGTRLDEFESNTARLVEPAPGLR